MTNLTDAVARAIIEAPTWGSKDMARAAIAEFAKWLRSDASGCWDVIDYVRLHDTNTIIRALATHLESETK